MASPQPKPAPPKDHRVGHRARLRARFLADLGDAMPDYELLEMLLFLAQPRGDTKPVAKALLARHRSLAGVLAAAPHDLLATPGVGDSAVTAIKVARQIGLRMTRTEIIDRPVLTTWEKVVAYCHASLAHEATERFHVLFLDVQNTLIADELQQRGTIDRTPVYPREVVKRALELNASAVIMVHNHPAGDPTPSAADIAITRELVEAGKPLGVAVHDHIVIGRTGHASLKSMGLI